jgi:kynurenine formamidase
MQLIDLSHTIKPGMQTFSTSAPQPKIYPWMSHAQAANSEAYTGCTCEITEVRFLTSIGTYLDSPYHFHPEKQSIESLEIDQLVLPGVLIDCTFAGKRQPITPEVLTGIDIQGAAVLFYTGWSQHWGQNEYAEHPFLTQRTAEVLQERGAKMAGVDFLVIDDTRDPTRPVHVTLLKHDILIVENLTNLKHLPGSGFTFHAVPVKVAGAAAFPVRAYAVHHPESRIAGS